MKNQVDGNGKINNSQRKILSKLAVEVLEKKIQEAKDESGELVAQIREKVREELGFGRYNDSLISGSKAKTLVDKRTGTACEKVKELEEQKTDVVSGIWTSATLSQALSILESARKL